MLESLVNALDAAEVGLGRHDHLSANLGQPRRCKGCQLLSCVPHCAALHRHLLRGRKRSVAKRQHGSSLGDSRQHSWRFANLLRSTFRPSIKGESWWNAPCCCDTTADVRLWDFRMTRLAKKPHLARIWIYPIKSLDPFELERVGLASGLRLAGDRDHALLDAQGRLLNAKRLGSSILSIRAAYSDQGGVVEFAAGSESGRFELPEDRGAIEGWLGRVLGQPVSLGQNSVTGFPDDEDASGPTVIGSGSIHAVAEWFGLSAEEVRRRFRANLEIAGLGPFEEDTLFGPPGRPKTFRIGEVQLLGVNPCRRCVVPTLDSHGDSSVRAFSAKQFSALREHHSRCDSSLARYSGYYRLAVNTRIEPLQSNKQLRVGDELTLVG